MAEHSLADWARVDGRTGAGARAGDPAGFAAGRPAPADPECRVARPGRWWVLSALPLTLYRLLFLRGELSGHGGRVQRVDGPVDAPGRGCRSSSPPACWWAGARCRGTGAAGGPRAGPGGRPGAPSSTPPSGSSTSSRSAGATFAGPGLWCLVGGSGGRGGGRRRRPEQVPGGGAADRSGPTGGSPVRSSSWACAGGGSWWPDRRPTPRRGGWRSTRARCSWALPRCRVTLSVAAFRSAHRGARRDHGLRPVVDLFPGAGTRRSAAVPRVFGCGSRRSA